MTITKARGDKNYLGPGAYVKRHQVPSLFAVSADDARVSAGGEHQSVWK